MYLALNRGRVYPRTHALNGFNSLIDDFFVGSSIRAGKPEATALAARFDVTEKGNVYEARLEIPGVTKDDIDVTIDGATVSVKAEAKTEEKAAEGERVLHSSRVARSWARTFTLPAEVDEDRAEAAYENGVLTLTLPKKDVVQPKRLAIK